MLRLGNREKLRNQLQKESFDILSKKFLICKAIQIFIKISFKDSNILLKIFQFQVFLQILPS